MWGRTKQIPKSNASHAEKATVRMIEGGKIDLQNFLSGPPRVEEGEL